MLKLLEPYSFLGRVRCSSSGSDTTKTEEDDYMEEYSYDSDPGSEVSMRKHADPYGTALRSLSLGCSYRGPYFEIRFLNLLPIPNTFFLGQTCMSAQRRMDDFHRPAFDLTPAQMAHLEGWGQEMLRKAGRKQSGKPKKVLSKIVRVELETWAIFGEQSWREFLFP